MFLISQEQIDSYLQNDITEARLNKASCSGDENLVCQKWLRESAAKRYIFEHMYGRLLESTTPLRVLDVGGGLTSITRDLAMRHDYLLVDLLAHDSHDFAESLMTESARRFIIEADWLTAGNMETDVVIANDIFPNVDQRLDLFLSRFLPITKKIVLSLTYYDDPRYYFTRRIDGDEVLCFLAWDWRQLQSVLEKYSGCIESFDGSIFKLKNKSVFKNGRRVCLVEFKGYLS